MARVIRLGRWRVKLPASAFWRMVIGGLLVLGGCMGFLPVLGFWMAPMGLVVLSIDLPPVRRLRRRMNVWWGHRRAQPKEK